MDNAMIHIPVSPGELVDKITILEIKEARITDPGKLTSVKKELALLRKELAKLPSSEDLVRLTAELRLANEKVWDVEELVRKSGTSDTQFLEWSKISHVGNDERFGVKRKINDLLGSRIQEVKSHQS